MRLRDHELYQPERFRCKIIEMARENGIVCSNDLIENEDAFWHFLEARQSEETLLPLIKRWNQSVIAEEYNELIKGLAWQVEIGRSSTTPRDTFFKALGIKFDG